MGQHQIPPAIREAIDAGIAPARAFRIYADRTIPELAAVAHLDPRRLCRIEAGDQATPAEVQALCGALHVPPELMFQYA